MASRLPANGLVGRAAVVVSGVVVAHTLDYVVVVGDPTRRRVDLAATGHGYWRVAVGLALVAVSVAVSWAARAGARRPPSSAAARDCARRSIASSAARERARHAARAATMEAAPRPYPATLARLAAAQMAGFAAIETIERMAAGAPVAGLATSLPLLVGLALQVVVAAVFVGTLAAVTELAARVAARPRRRQVRSAPSTAAISTPGIAIPGGSVAGRLPPRGPPALAA
ncbi:MAG: hypothetical protein ABR511_08150 [Acidimicrobiales bacterium]